MEDFPHPAKPVALTRPRGAHRLEAFSLKLNRRLTLYQRCTFDQWIMIEVDAAARLFCERPGYVQIQEKRLLADFLVSYSDRKELVLLPGSATADAMSHDLTFEGDGAIDVRIISPAELAASRMWIDNWKRMLPCLVVTRGLLEQSLLDAVLNFVANPKALSVIEREFSGGDPILARAAVFKLLYAGRLTAPELRVNALSPTTLFVAEESRL
ncbi:hypothetical protein SBC1_80080 (plasmid) [Caballeronia sp. SBC1]|uniref:hypothetical protein n=1 Tax=Caballeronia sp. SBC1 TaxID=2705548 RepID=UPI00140E3F55|nr:hypothetical protein [Caballeronia sp. SBC1]QIN67961.1 hypothetical protein SBC1_80080 [Caballeronia sp. SBC1]